MTRRRSNNGYSASWPSKVSSIASLARSFGLNKSRTYEANKRRQHAPFMLMSLQNELTPNRTAIFSGTAMIVAVDANPAGDDRRGSHGLAPGVARGHEDY